VRSKSRSAAGFPSHCDSGDDDARRVALIRISIGVLSFRTRHRELRRICIAVSIVGTLALLVALSLTISGERLSTGCRNRSCRFSPGGLRRRWQMFLERPLTGWGVNQMPSELART